MNIHASTRDLAGVVQTILSADLIMLGHKHRDNWLERWWAGSIPKAMIEHSRCSVLVVITK
jgi:nucleotide-binding universal stress UspA family protein